ncbi:SEC-C domain-containing protein [Bacillus sp. ISL-41]|uniref:SEC-C metal-binding domain-containing protein n=1 Tax=Bacillus sp. ISL-41 TaxID=2819127 RepID=UPI001BE80BE9|nr:SEC-C metal-binding domain-containing protein [Bacillus sp. ISL-41]MBT2644686.1 SEC-C domain-containing protein [Bacillus sp. ISL-41]
MSFLDRIKPFLLSDDLLVHRYVMHSLREFPDIPEEWTVQLLRQALANKGQESLILISLEHAPLNRESLELLIQGADNADLDRKHLYLRLLDKADPNFILANRDLAERFYSEEMLKENVAFLASGSESMWNQYHATLAELEKEKYFNSNLYGMAKEIARILARNGFVDDGYIQRNFDGHKNKEFFSFEDILAVYMAKEMKLEQHIPYFAGLLERDDDLLLEELLEVLSSFQSDAVVESVNPDIEDSAMVIFPIGVLKNTKTQSSVDKLIKYYSMTTDPEVKMYIVEALCSQLTEDAFPIVEDAIQKKYDTSAFEVDELYYGFYKVMGVQHPKLAEWGKSAMERREYYDKRSRELNDLNFTSSAVPKNEPKVGRNEPCLCGSGKKYKKCCGK